jgi:hypothetical protein
MRRDAKFFIGMALGIALFLFIVGYAYHRSKDLISGPIITVFSPQNNEILNNPLVEIQGNIKDSISETLDERKIFLDTSGNFKEKLLLQNGYNIISLKAVDRFGRKTEKRLDLVYQGPNIGIAPLSTNTLSTSTASTSTLSQ